MLEKESKNLPSHKSSPPSSSRPSFDKRTSHLQPLFLRTNSTPNMKINSFLTSHNLSSSLHLTETGIRLVENCWSQKTAHQEFLKLLPDFFANFVLITTKIGMTHFTDSYFASCESDNFLAYIDRMETKEKCFKLFKKMNLQCEFRCIDNVDYFYIKNENFTKVFGDIKPEEIPIYDYKTHKVTHDLFYRMSDFEQYLKTMESYKSPTI